MPRLWQRTRGIAEEPGAHVRMPRVRSSDVDHSWHGDAPVQIAADRVVLGRASDGNPLGTITRRATGISLAATILAKACRQSDASRAAEGQQQACSRTVQASRKTPAPAPLRVRLSSNAKCGGNLGQRDKPRTGQRDLQRIVPLLMPSAIEFGKIPHSPIEKLAETSLNTVTESSKKIPTR